MEKHTVNLITEYLPFYIDFHLENDVTLNNPVVDVLIWNVLATLPRYKPPFNRRCVRTNSNLVLLFSLASANL